MNRDVLHALDAVVLHQRKIGKLLGKERFQVCIQTAQVLGLLECSVQKCHLAMAFFLPSLSEPGIPVEASGDSELVKFRIMRFVFSFGGAGVIKFYLVNQAFV